jgi:hypothetical protein
MRVWLEAECGDTRIEIINPELRLRRVRETLESWVAAMRDCFDVSVKVLANDDGDVFDKDFELYFESWLRSAGIDARTSRSVVSLNLRRGIRSKVLAKYAEERGLSLIEVKLRCGPGITYHYYAAAELKPRSESIPASWLQLAALMKHPCNAEIDI